jgi:RND superfamily putative drug exporter
MRTSTTGATSTVGRLAALPCGRRTKWLVLIFWVVLLSLSGPLAGKLNGAQKNDAESWLPGSAESTEVLDLQTTFYPRDTLPAIVIYARESGITAADLATAADDAAAFAKIDGVEGKVSGPVPAADRQAIQVIVPVGSEDGGWQKIAKTVDGMREIVAADANGLETHITGPAGTAADSAGAFEGIDGRLLYAALAVVIVTLLLTYRSPTLWLLPVLSAATALTSAQAVIYLLAEHAGLTVNAQSAGILTVLVFGAGTDYALLLVARYREELRRHEDRHEAMAYALHRAGPAIFASASTVAVGMLCLLVADMNSTKGLGPVAAIGILVGLFAMLTLLPALLVIVGRWIFWPVRPMFGSDEPTERGLWARAGRSIARRPRTVWIATTAALGLMALGALNLNASGLASRDSFIGTPDSIVGEDVLADHFPAGLGQPLVVIGNAEASGQLATALRSTPGIVGVDQPVPPRDGLAYLEATLADPPDSQAAKDTVDRARDAVHAVPGADAKLGGGTAIQVDAQRAAARDSKLIIPLVLFAVLVILAILLRALVAPLVLVATVVLSFAAALGVSALVFDHVFGFAGADTSFPLFVFVFLVALGIDYNIFLMTRVREEAHRVGTRRGALIGLAATGAVITSAGLVLAGTFAVLATLPVVAFAEIGFAVAFGVLLDTIVVRSVLVTALTLDIGRRMWWPGKLAEKRDVDADELARTEPAAISG